MADAETEVECPICDGTFDPTAAGGWCTNPDCGEWQYEGGTETETETESEAEDDVSAEVEAGHTEAADAAVEDPVETTEADEEVADEEVADADAQVDADGATGEEHVGDAAAQAEADTDADPAGDEAEAATEDAIETATEDAAEPATEEATETAADEGDEQPAEDAVEVAADAAPEPEATADAAEAAEADDVAEEPATVECSDCGTELAADANFCIECGADVQAVESGADELTACPSCGVDLDGDEHFCANCGEDLDAHRGDGDTKPETTGADAVETLAAQTEEDEGDEPVPDSLVLSVLGTDINVADGDRVGRDVRAALTDAGRPEDEAVRIHREHVRFVREADSFYLVDLGDNPTKLNGRSLQKGDREPVGPGDELELSGVATITIDAP